MHPQAASDRAKMVAWAFVARSAQVGAVLLLSLVPGVSVTAALILVAGSLFLRTAVGLIFPANRLRREQGGAPPNGRSGDRAPRSPFPVRPDTAAARPLPPA